MDTQIFIFVLLSYNPLCLRSQEVDSSSGSFLHVLCVLIVYCNTSVTPSPQAAMFLAFWEVEKYDLKMIHFSQVPMGNSHGPHQLGHHELTF